MLNNSRLVAETWPSQPTIEGAGVHLKRAFGFDEVPALDPFLLLDDFHADNPALYLPGFPWHPHRGIETITYLLEGRVEHGDSMGNEGVINPGDVQWMTAGSGIIHQEMPKGDAQNRMWGFQLWANLPRSHKMMDPRYRGVTAEEIPLATLPSGVTARVVCGSLGGVVGPVQDIVTDPAYFDVIVPPATVFEHEVKAGHTVFAYVVSGQATFDPRQHQPIGRERLVLYEQAGAGVTITTADEPVRFLLVSGRPLGEPVAWRGPIVMNTQEELYAAFEQYRNGTFIKSRSTG
jgi:quercetin 2,3-dioxygenase